MRSNYMRTLHRLLILYFTEITSRSFFLGSTSQSVNTQHGFSQTYFLYFYRVQPKAKPNLKTEPKTVSEMYCYHKIYQPCHIYKINICHYFSFRKVHELFLYISTIIHVRYSITTVLPPFYIDLMHLTYLV